VKRNVEVVLEKEENVGNLTKKLGTFPEMKSWRSQI